MPLLVVTVTVLAVAVAAALLWARRRRRGAHRAASGSATRPATGPESGSASRSPRTPTPASSAPAGSDPFPGLPSDAELDAAFDAVLAEHAHELGDLLQTRLRGLVARGVPLRAIRSAPGTRTARVCFADGTVVLARSSGGRELADLVVGMQSGSVVLAGFVREGDASRLVLRSRAGRPLALLAIGLDQPD